MLEPKNYYCYKRTERSFRCIPWHFQHDKFVSRPWTCLVTAWIGFLFLRNVFEPTLWSLEELAMLFVLTRPYSVEKKKKNGYEISRTKRSEELRDHFETTNSHFWVSTNSSGFISSLKKSMESRIELSQNWSLIL